MRRLIAIVAALAAPGVVHAEDDAGVPAEPAPPVPTVEPAPADPQHIDDDSTPSDRPSKKKGQNGDADADKRGMGGEEDIEGDGKPKSEVTVGGRVFARGEVADTDAAPWTGQLSLASARLGASYRWKDRLRVKAVIEAASGKAAVRDAFVEAAAGGGVLVRAGRFKGLVSAVERESAWRLPTIDRGAVAEVLQDGIGLTGRSNGVGVSWATPVEGMRLLAVASL